MYDGKPHKSVGKSAAGEAERRGNDRHAITASAEVVELGSGAKFSTRTTDLGPGGCFVDTMVPFPVGANVRVKVHKGKTQFETGGLVVYSQAGLGMGIAFSNMEDSQRSALDEWLADLTGGKQAAHHHDSGYAGSSPSENRPGDKTALVRLVRLMITKGILTEAEGASVLMDPLL
ncbi:MAG TPA: PilZ domain-containing protein [Candidatus Acidoferrales bacterium]|jgi:hypothetical protein